ncbi:class I SAM-dependent methyltransferase [Pedobacter sp. MW01-1-1]|uniref:class I SAM-dependent methyltransferase n=1 Tax=Pedobacter sp. MW01-1-1 TaxID=3383027 RepID=UPI003FEE483B
MGSRETHLERLIIPEAKLDHLWYLHYKPYHEDLFNAFKLYASGNLLDIGCGNKPYQEVLNSYVSHYLGCDIIQSSQEVVDILCYANQIPLNDCSFDTVISTQTIEHVEDHQGLVNEAYRLLRSEGFFILSGPMYWPLHEEPYDFFRFTKHGFTFILEKAGFEVVKIYSNGGKWSVAGQAFLHALYPQINSIKGFKGKSIRFIFKVIGGIKSVNRLFQYLDNIYRDDSNTMNYVFVAKKK